MDKTPHGYVPNTPLLHEMRLDKEPFEMIKNGRKTVELRLNDERRKCIKPGDLIRLLLRDSDEMILIRVTALYRAESFAILFETGGLLAKCGWGNLTPSEAAQMMRKYYSEEDEIMHGALGIEFSVIIKEPIETPIIAL